MTNNSNRHCPVKPLVLTSPKQRQGGQFEQRACEFLQAQGLILIAQNWQQPKVGELDLIMLESRQAWPILVFIEVRQRQRSNFGDAVLSVTKAKQNKVVKTAQYFLQRYPEYADYECRFDVVAYNIERCNQMNDSEATYRPEWLMGAFIAQAW